MRTCRWILCLFASMVALAACGAGASAPPGPADGGNGAFPVTVGHEFGETVISAPPQRVVALGVIDADPLLALGITPIAVTGYPFYPSGLGPWATPLVQGSPPVRLGSDSAPELEQIAALRPDLIIGVTAGFDDATYRQLSRIAPTVARAPGTAAYTGSRDDRTRIIARAVGRAADGERLLEQARQAVRAAQEANPRFAGRTAVVALPFEGRYGAFTAGDPRGALPAELGFALPPPLAALDTGERFFIDLSAERTGLLDGDVLVVLADEPARRAQVDGDPVLAQVPVVRDGRMIVADLDLRGALTYNSVLSVPFALERLVPRLAEVLTPA